MGKKQDHSLRCALLLAIACLGGCTTMAPGRKTPEPVTRLPGEYPGADGTAPYRPAAWWRDFEDPKLNALVDKALSDNLDIAEAAARLARARAQARIAGAPLVPSVNAGGSVSYSSTPLSGTAFGDFGGGRTRLESETYSLSLGASYELDLFGRVRADLLARRADAAAVAHDLHAVQLAAAAETIATYFTIVDGRRQIELTLAHADVLTERVARTEDRYRSGLVESFELYQVRQELRDVQASLPLLESALDAAEGRLALLLREYPEDARERLEGPLTPRLAFEPVPAGLPSALLVQRPDVAAAWLRLEAARYDIGARRAERFPSLSLGASTGTQAGAPGDLSDINANWALSLVANIVAPIIDGGRISARIAAARATYDERAAVYARAVLNAYREVASASEDYEEKRQRYRMILAQLADARAALDLQVRRFRAGVGGYIAYLDAVRAENRIQANLSAAGRDVALARLGVHRALGGDWTEHRDLTPLEMIAPIETGDAK